MSNQVFSNLDQRIRYSLTGQIHENPQDETTTINGDLHLPDLQYDVSNDDVVTIDGIGILYKTTKINMLESTDALIKSIELTEEPLTNEANLKCLSYNDLSNQVELTTLGGGGNPFDQDLNTTDDVIFNSITTDLIQEEGLNAGITLNNRVILPNITTANSVNSILSVDFGSFNVEKTVGTIDSIGRIVCTNINTGQGQNDLYPMNQGVLTTDDVVFNNLTVNNELLIPNMAIQAGVYPLLAYDGGSGEVVKNNNILLTPSGDVLALFGGVNGSSITSTGLITGQNLTLANININNTEDQLLVLNNVSNTVEYRDASTLPAQNPFDQSLNIADPVQFSGLTLSNVANAPNNLQILTLNPLLDFVEITDSVDLPFITSGISVDNAIPKYDGIAGNLQNTGIIIDDFNDLTSPGSITCDTPTIAPELDAQYVVIKKDTEELKQVLLDDLFGQNLSVSANVTHNNVFIDNILQTDTILENSLNNGVDITNWNIKSQNITSQAVVSETNPLSINLDIAGDSDSLIQIVAEEHNRLDIAFDCHHLDGGPRDSYISSSFDGNFIIQKIDTGLDFLAINGITKGTGFSKQTMNNVVSFAKTQFTVQQNAVFANSIVASNLSTDPEAEVLGTILVTQSSLTNEIWKRPYDSVYGTAVGTIIPVIVPLPVISTYTIIPNSYALTESRNCSAIGNAVIIDAGISTFRCSIDYSVSFSSGSNSTIEYDFIIIINSFTITGSKQSVVIKSADLRNNISAHCIAEVTALDDISLFVQNPLGTEQVVIHEMALTICKIFE